MDGASCSQLQQGGEAAAGSSVSLPGAAGSQQDPCGTQLWGSLGSMSGGDTVWWVTSGSKNGKNHKKFSSNPSGEWSLGTSENSKSFPA